jgi:hypothetical protein
MVDRKDNGPGHNSGATAKIELDPATAKVVTSVADEFRAIKAARAKLTERAAKQRDRLTAAGLEPAAFALALRMADLEDQAAQANYMASLSTTWTALDVETGQLDWVQNIEIEDAEAKLAADADGKAKPKRKRGAKSSSDALDDAEKHLKG